MKTIMIVDDSKELRQVLKLYLNTAGYEVVEAIDGVNAMELFNRDIDLMIVDIMMPNMDGYELVEEIRKKNNKLPIIFLSALDEVVDKIRGLQTGGDDYIAKPFDPMELVARVEALFRRIDVDELVRVQDLLLNKSEKRIYYGNKALVLTRKEYEILVLLISNPHRIFSKSELFNYAWDDEYIADDNTMMVHISNLRSKIGDSKYIVTVRGLGYSLLGDGSYE